MSQPVAGLARVQANRIGFAQAGLQRYLNCCQSSYVQRDRCHNRSWTRKSSDESAMGSRILRTSRSALNCCQSSYVFPTMSQPVAGLARVQAKSQWVRAVYRRQRYLNCCQSSYVFARSMLQPVAGLARVQTKSHWVREYCRLQRYLNCCQSSYGNSGLTHVKIAGLHPNNPESRR